MPRLPNDLIAKVNQRGVELFFADRSVTRYWNERRLKGEPTFFGGWYWYLAVNGRAVSEEHGPFRTSMAAYRDAAVKLQIS